MLLVFLMIYLYFLLVLCCPLQAHALPPEAVQRRDERCLQEAYPHTVEGLVREGNEIWLKLRDGQRVLYADERPPMRDADGALTNATVSQSLELSYPKGQPTTDLPTEDPGRERSDALMRALYGDDASRLQLVTIKIGKSAVRFSARQQAAEALRRVAASLENLARDPALNEIIFPLGGGQNWRSIAGTTRLSSHSFGIAIDLNPQKGTYWRESSERPVAYPQAIVDAFEAEGFIWGGRWVHFDAMHFEYRPELFCKRVYEYDFPAFSQILTRILRFLTVPSPDDILSK